MSKLYAFYSPKQAQRFGTVLYSQENGKELVASCVSESVFGYGKWDDIQFIGFVDKFVRRIDFGIAGPPPNDLSIINYIMKQLGE